MSLTLPKVTVLAVALAFCGAVSLPAYADESPEQLKQRIDQLESQVKKLQDLVQKAMAKADAASAATTASTDQQEQLDHLQVKVDAMDDAQQDSGFKDLKISGMIDPTYIYNKDQDSAGFNFLNNFDARDTNTPYAYDNSYFGQAMLEIDKELESGTQLKLTIAPHKSAQSGYNLNSIIHEANMSMPVNGDANTRFLAGIYADWSGYEYYFGNQNKLITHNLLFDFAAMSYYNGAGMELVRGDWDIKALIANVNQNSQISNKKSPMLTYRGDYSWTEYTGFGFAGMEGKYLGNQLDMLEFDGYYTRGDWNWQWQVGGGRWRNEAFNGGDAQWLGASTLLSFNFTPRLTGIARLDYLKNDKNGGGTIGTSLDNTVGGDYRNGFGPSPTDYAAWSADNTLSINGANRSALSLGLNYALTEHATLKAEYRFDHSSQETFINTKDGSYTKNNQLFGLSTVLTF